MKTGISSFSILIIVMLFTASCQKELDGSGAGGGPIVPVSQKPKLGTTWTYYYYRYHSYGGVAEAKIMIHKAKTEETLGGEKWLNVVDMATDTTVYFLNIKTGGLYQYANNSSNLFCKYPAVVNDTYTTFNSGSTEDFTVKGVNDTLQTGIGDVPANYYEGFKVGKLIDLVWYTDNAWIVRRLVYRVLPSPIPVYYLHTALYIDNIIY